VDRGCAAKPSAMEILQDRSAGSHALENADDQNAIASLPPKSHIQSYRIWLRNIDAIAFSANWCSGGMLVILLPFAIATTKSFRWFDPQTEVVALTKIIGPHVCSGHARFTFTRTRAREAITPRLSVP
jgi:hypothetical protein